MILVNKLNIADQIELAKVEEKISKQKAKRLFDSGDIHQVQVGKFAGLAFIHAYLFGDIYPFVGQIRDVNTKKLGMFIHMHFSSGLKFIHINQQLTKIPA